MGKKLQGAKLRAVKRAKLALEELQEQQAETSATLTVTTQTNDDLFVIDRVGEAVPHHKRPSSTAAAKVAAAQQKFQKTGLSALDQKQVDAMLQVHDATKVQQLAAEGRKRMDQYQSQNKRLTRSPAASKLLKTRANFDLWNNAATAPEEGTPPAGAAGAVAAVVTATKAVAKRNKLTADALAAKTVTTTLPENAKTVQTISGIGSTLAGLAPSHVATKATTRTSKRKRGSDASSTQALTTNPAAVTAFTSTKVSVDVHVASAGQSYHPDPVQHQQVLQTAAAVEVARNKALDYRDTPISNGLSAETKALLIAEDDDEDSDEDDGNGNTVNAGEIPKRANKLTKAQRNKQKRQRVEQAIQRQAKTTKKLLNQVSEVPRYKKELKREQQTAAQIQQEKLERQAAKLKEPVGTNVELQAAQSDPVNAPTFPVALPTELKSSLRSIKPKGSLVQDRVLSLTARRQMVSLKQTPDAVRKRQQSRKKRKLAVKGKHNRDAIGDTFEILG